MSSSISWWFSSSVTVKTVALVLLVCHALVTVCHGRTSASTTTAAFMTPSIKELNSRHQSSTNHDFRSTQARNVGHYGSTTKVPSNNSLRSMVVVHNKRPSSSLLLAKSSSASSSDIETCECLVVGGGISGCTLAYNLHHTHNVDVLLCESRDYLGGNVKSHVDELDEGTFIWEEGPNSFATQPSIVRIAYELGISDQLVFADERLPPWVNFNGKLHPLPKGQGSKGPKGQLELVFGPNGVMKFALLGELLSWPGKIRAGIGAFLAHAPPPTNKEETIREWVERILGTEVFLRCIDPFVSGVYAGDPETLSMKAALPKIARIEDISYSIGWNKGGAIFYGGLKRQVELTKERKADPPAPEWPEFEYGNPGSFAKGLSTLPNAIHKVLGSSQENKVRLNYKLIKVEPIDEKNDADGYKYLATFEATTGSTGDDETSTTTTKQIKTKSVVSTMPAHALKGVFDQVIPEANELCERIRDDINRVGIYHPPVAAVTVAYPKNSFKDVELPNDFGNLQDLPGFGSLNPRTEGVRTLGTLWSSSLFPGRCPPNYNLLLNYIGGSRDVELSKLSKEDIIKEVDKGCRQVLLKDDAPEPIVLGLKLWPTAIPQYELGHLQLMDLLQKAEDKVDGLWICGNYRTGVAFPDCVTYGYNHAKTVAQFLGKEQKVVSTATTTTTTSTSTTTSSSTTTTTTKQKKLPYFLTQVEEGEGKTQTKSSIKGEKSKNMTNSREAAKI